MNPRRLYRSRDDRQLAGVAGGMAHYLEVDPTVVRILWLLSAFAGGFTILLYIILAFVIPLEPQFAWPAATVGATGDAPDNAGDGVADGAEVAPGTGTDGWAADPAGTGAWRGSVRQGHHGPGAAMYAGVLLIVFGAVTLADSMIPAWAGHGAAGPAVLLALGAILLVGATRRTAGEP